MHGARQGQTIDELLDTFESLRLKNVENLKASKLSSEQLSQRGARPQLGPVTLKELLAMWVVHDLNHIAQVAKARLSTTGRT